MIEYERMEIAEGIYLNKSNKSKECMVCYFWHFLDIGYKYEQYVCNRCHDLSMTVSDLDDFMILNIEGVY